MARAHGDNVYRHAAKQLAKVGAKEINQQVEEQTRAGRQVEIRPMCPCSWRPWPHYHTLYQRIQMAKIWNQQSTHKITKLPVEDTW